jgi:diguanylate cyclase (GGDEF)-like protein
MTSSVNSMFVPRRLWPFASAALFGVLLALVPGTHTDALELGIGVGLTLSVLTAAVAAPWRSLPAWSPVVPAFTYLLAVALLRDATGGAATGFGPLMLLPVFWLALYGTRGQLLALLGGVATVYYAPMLLIGGAAYPLVGWRAGALFVVVAAIIGLSTHELIRRLRTLLEERAELMARFERLAKTDALTGLPNRRAWEDALGTAFAAALRSDRAVTVAVIDLDHFKALNDRHGHPYGDRVLAACADAWSAELRPGDLLARLGGEEFGLLLDCPLEAAGAVIARLRAATPYLQTCSAGVTEWDHAEGADDLLARADRLLYQAKEQGRDRAVATEPRGQRIAAIPEAARGVFG